MSLITYGDANTAPQIFDNARGMQPWSGKRADELTANDLLDILEFCENEAWRKGWNDEQQGIARPERAALVFHPDFLRGWPHVYWVGYYEDGRKDWRAEREAAVTEQAGSQQ
jgi:hypothetical protein